MGFLKGFRSGGILRGDGEIRSYEFSAIPPKQRKAGEWLYLVVVLKAVPREEFNKQQMYSVGV